MSDTNNININKEKAKETVNVEQQKDIMEEKANEIKSIYETMIKLRKQNLSGNKKFESSN